MAWFRSRDFLLKRIDRCYLIAAGARVPHKRKVHLERARYYRSLFYRLCQEARPGLSVLAGLPVPAL